MEENKKPDNRRIRMGNWDNYNESVGRDYIQGDVYNINISQDEDSQASVNKSENFMCDFKIHPECTLSYQG
ncbi:MAG: hypothetical protein AAGE84_16810 [Cyanobacteria bacterium P01_G01_bin.39]